MGCEPLIPALGRARPEDSGVEASLGSYSGEMKNSLGSHSRNSVDSSE